ncbi:MAG: lysylphosphatidylglycerol synthase domain-containing protein [Bacteroidota bacterium]
MKRPFNSRLFNLLIKTAVLLLLGYVLYYQVFARENIGDIKAVFWQRLDRQHLSYLLLAALLMPLNWAFETLKWQGLIRDFEPLSFWRSYRAVLGGVTFSIFTPNRIGEYGGRILFVRAENNWKAVIATLVGSFSQLLVLLAVGLLGLIHYAGSYLELEPLMLRSLGFMGLVLVGAMVFSFYNIDLVVPLARRLPFIHYLRPFAKQVSILQDYDSPTLTRTLAFALARYTVYTLQYYLLLRFFGFQIPTLPALTGIATIFLLQTSIPLPPLMGLFVRGEVALQIWGIFSENELGILASSFSLWVLNLILPALFGMVFILNTNVLKSLGYENKSN